MTLTIDVAAIDKSLGTYQVTVTDQSGQTFISLVHRETEVGAMREALRNYEAQVNVG